jgi:hypothetical protein
LLDPNAEKNEKVNLYGKYFDKFIEEQRKKNGGEIPSWLKLVQVIFNFASDQAAQKKSSDEAILI